MTIAEVFEKVKAKAWSDAEFKKLLLTNAKEAIKKETGVEIPADVNVTIIEQKAKALHFVLPENPNAAGELSEDDLEQVAGGADKPNWYEILEAEELRLKQAGN